MKKLLSLVILFGMSAVLAGDMPEQVDIYSDASFSSKEMVGFPVGFLAGLGCVEWGMSAHRKGGVLTEEDMKLALSGGILSASMVLVFGLRMRQYLSRHIPILSLREDGLWYHQKFICKWDDVDGMTHVLDQHGIRLLHIYDRSATVLVKIALEDLDYVYDDLINDLNRFIDAAHPNHSRLR